MKTHLKLFALAALCVAALFSTAALATPKDDYWAAHLVCERLPTTTNAAGEVVVTDARIACDKAALLDLIIATSPTLQLQSPASKTKPKAVTRSAVDGRFVTAAEGKRSPATTVTETARK